MPHARFCCCVTLQPYYVSVVIDVVSFPVALSGHQSGVHTLPPEYTDRSLRLENGLKHIRYMTTTVVLFQNTAENEAVIMIVEVLIVVDVKYHCTYNRTLTLQFITILIINHIDFNTA